MLDTTETGRYKHPGVTIQDIAKQKSLREL